MIHPPSTGSDFWGPGLRRPFDPAKFVLGSGIEALQLKQGKPAAFLGGMGEGEDHRLVFLRRHRFGGRKGTVVAGADQPIEVAMNNGGLHGVIDGHQAFGGGKVRCRPTTQVGANAERALHGTEHTIGKRSGSAVEPVRQLESRSEEHTSELQSRLHLVCRLLLEKKKRVPVRITIQPPPPPVSLRYRSSTVPA